MEVYSLSWTPTESDGDPADSDRRTTTGRDERAVLGRALDARSNDILRMCQSKFVERADDMDLELVSRHPMWEIILVAVAAITDWLQTGTGASDPARSRIASVGRAAAIDQEQATAKRSSARTGPGPVVESGEDRSGVLSVAMITKLNLWWKDATCLILAEEAGRLGISDETLDAATEMVGRSCNASLVNMAKQYDNELDDLHARLLHLASHDQLTGLANRAVLLTRLETAIARLDRRPGGLAVVFMDLDDFKSVNDAFGHNHGDELLTVIGERFTCLMRSEDTVARFGGDEFVALFEDLTNPAYEAEALAQRLQRAVAEPIPIAGQPLRITASIGVAVVTGPDCRSEEVLIEADRTMYDAKRGGRNRVTLVEMT